MSFLDNIFNKPPPTPNLGDENFIIYTMDVLNDPAYIMADGDVAELEELEVDDTSIAVAFQGITNFGIRKKSNIPYEPLENGQFSSDSIGGTPFEIAIIAEVAPAFRISTNQEDNITSDEDRRAYIGDVEDMLTDAVDNKTQFVLLFKNPLFKNYINIKLSSFIYDITPDHKNMTAFLTFQQVRVSNPEYNYVPLDSVDGASNASQRTNGATAPQTPNATIQELVS